MGKVLAWILSLTKAGKLIDSARKPISGWGSYLTGAGMIFPALLTIVKRFGDIGAPYLTTMFNEPEWIALMGGIAIIRVRGAVTKAVNHAKDPNAPEFKGTVASLEGKV